jgi:RNA polymerase sigma-70 factor, ECF subfamily
MATIMLTPPLTQGGDQQVLEALRAGDEEVFVELVGDYQPLMSRVARSLVPTRQAADDLVRQAWLDVLDDLDGLHPRCTFRAFLMGTLVARAGARSSREGMSWLAEHAAEPVVDPARFSPPGHHGSAGWWATPPVAWDGAVEMDEETQSVLLDALENLPAGQYIAVSLRDSAGWSAREVCDAMGLPPDAMRRLLNGGRSALRRALEVHYGDRLSR